MIKIQSNVREVLSWTQRLASEQIPFATALALTRTAKDVEKEAYAEMNRVWEQPTPFSKRSLFVRPATKQSLTATVEIKDQFPSKARLSPDQTYRHQYFGGKRERKGLELYAQGAGLISASEILVPASGAKLDQYGNMSRGQLAQIMSQLRLGLDPASYKSKSRRSRTNQAKAGQMFWSRGGHLERGVWMRVGSTGVRPIMLAASAPAYAARMSLERVANRVVPTRFPAQFDQALGQALATAR